MINNGKIMSFANRAWAIIVKGMKAPIVDAGTKYFQDLGARCWHRLRGS
jgi:hypothetical protein